MALQLIITTIQPTGLFALTSGPSQPEFNSFTPIGTSDMVDLSSGDFSYNIPLVDVGGYPLNLSYSSGITMDQEASWVGLGWNLNVGQINRQLRGLPDDFNGDEMTYENNLRTNFTAGVNTGLNFPVFGFDFLGLNLGVGMQYNNYNGITFDVNYGPSFNISEQLSAGINISSSSDGDASVTPKVGLKTKKDGLFNYGSLTTNIGIPFNSNQGLKGLNLSASASGMYGHYNKNINDFEIGGYSGSTSSFISFNDNLSFQPTNQLSFVNASLTLDFGLGTEIFGSEGPQGQITGFGSLQALRNDDKVKRVKAYGYTNTENAPSTNMVLDFNRENDRTITTNTTMLPIVNQTYDLYAIQGQGIGGMFRPRRSQVGHVYDETVSYTGVGGSVGFEVGPGLAVHLGGNVKVNPSYTRSGRWQGNTNHVGLNAFRYNNSDTDLDYEPVYYKTIGELTGDSDPVSNNSIFSEVNPLKIAIGGSEYKRRTLSNYQIKQYDSNNSVSYTTNQNLGVIKRNSRENRTQAIQMLKYGDVKRNEDGQIRINTLPNLDANGQDFTIPDHHHVGIKITKPDGSRYVYGETAYNLNKIEATFATESSNGDCLTGLVNYLHDENTRNNSSGRDHYVNKAHTPPYAHTYLLSSVLSSDYKDLTNDGPTDDDLGAYTKFTYTTPSDFNWRLPFGTTAREAMYKEGIRTDVRDNKANYLYGVKQLKYVRQIETKTHIAILHLSDREDAREAAGENGGGFGSTRSQKLDKIELFSKPDWEVNPSNAAPIKTVHFEYDYSLCKNTPNSSAATGGKLTLTKLYFTYRDSHMGEYTPYVFNYEKDLDGDGEIDNNPDYHIKGYDVWGNYKPISGACEVDGDTTNSEFPFVQQDDKLAQDIYTSAWTLTEIDLPSGGHLNVEYETDDYAYVQDKHAMQMFKVVGAGDIQSGSLGDNSLYSGSDDFDYIYVQITNGTTQEEFLQDYLGDIGETDRNPLYFRFMLNMTDEFDYVTGYSLIDKSMSRVFDSNGNTYASIKLKRVKREGGIINSNQMVNPIAKAGWYFGRKHLNRQIYGLPAPEIDEPGDLLALGQAYVSAIASVQTIFTGPNQALRQKNCARVFQPSKSWIRLYHPDDVKYGGGLRVKKVELHDNWDHMVGQPQANNYNPYSNFYGQQYTYTTTDGGSSGVATFEPNGSKENPLVQPFYDKHEKLIAPKESNYVEKPIGQSLYPNPTVTYSRVVVSNLDREREVDGNLVGVKKHATGRVINEFYTTKDFPTIADFTDITPLVDITGLLGSVLKVRTNKSLTYSQGFTVRTNDMNGKTKSQTVQSEGQSGNEYISKVEYKYSVNPDGTLNNVLDVIDEDGKVSKATIGVTHDMVNDFRSYYNSANVLGVDGNLAGIFVFLGIIPTPTLLPVFQIHEQEFKSVTTTKVIHSVGILEEKIAYDLGSSVSTKNLAWDAKTGGVLLTQTVNEYSDNYFSLGYPSHWYYDNMDQAVNNLNISGAIVEDQNTAGLFTIHQQSTSNPPITNANDYFTVGDELRITWMDITDPSNPIAVSDRAWVINIFTDSISLIDEQGQPFSIGNSTGANFRIHSSGYKNLQSANMASVTLQKSPIRNIGGIQQITQSVDWKKLNVVNASAVEYSDAWNSQCEFRLPNPDGVEFDDNGNITNLSSLGFNPYLYNVKGNWRAIKSYAYLTGRNNGTLDFHPRNEGFFTTFKPFYKFQGSNWVIDNPDPATNPSNYWTFASQVTEYSPYGAELENKDALNRFSAAQYGYRYTLPTAVGSNTQYRELAFDGFEDYNYEPLNGNNANPINPHFGFHDEVFNNTEANITDQESHSGRNSIRISPQSTASIEHRIIACDTIILQGRTNKK